VRFRIAASSRILTTRGFCGFSFFFGMLAR
jgi:hypothetical protein